jgi:hypothetical protein
MIGLDSYTAEFSDIAERVRRLSAVGREDMLAVCELGFSDRLGIRDEPVRVSVCKVTVALLPQSMQLVSRLLGLQRDAWDYEVHFSLFCWLDETQAFPERYDCREEVLVLLRGYLRRATCDERDAAWMAVDLLSEHWEVHGALSTLSEVAKEGNADCVRLEALSGLETLRARMDSADFDATARPLLVHLSGEGRNEEVRRGADDLFAKLYGGLSSRE